MNLSYHSKMSIKDLKKLKKRITDNSTELKKLYPISEDILISLNSLLQSSPCEIRIELWLNYMQETIDEISEYLAIIENQNDFK